MTRKTAAAIIAILGSLLLGACRRENTGAILATGTIEMTEVNISAKIGGRIGRILVGEGQRVEAGQTLAELEHVELDARLASARAALEAALLREKGARTAYDLAVRQLAAQTSQAEAGQEAAGQKLKLVSGGARREELAMARDAVDQAWAQLDLADKNLKRQQMLYEDDLIPQAQLDLALSQKQVAEAQYRSAQNRLELIQAGARDEEIALAESGDREARAGLEMARANAKLVEMRRDEISLAAAQVKQAEAALSLLEAEAAETRIAAPAGGLISIQTAQAGEIIGPGSPLFTLLETERPWLKVYLPLTQVERVRIGDPVRVTLDAYPHRSFAGRVTWISTEAEFTPSNLQTKEERVKQVFALKIQLKNSGRLLKAGMPADALIKPD